MGEWTLPALAVVLVAYAAVSGRLQGTWLSQATVFTVAGVVMAKQLVGVVEADFAGQVVRHLAEATLALVLFTDAVRINVHVLRREARLPIRLLGVGLPLTIAAGTTAAMVLFPSMDVWTAAVLAVVLAPTDAALGELVVSDERVPPAVRRGLNVESGLNDGLCVPLLIIFVTMAQTEQGDAEVRPVLVLAEEIGFGVLAGVAAGALGGWVLRTSAARGWMTVAWTQVNGVAVPLPAYTAASALGGSGFIAAFVAGMAYGALDPRRGEASTGLAEEAGEVLDALTFLLFGAVMVGPALEHLDLRSLGYALLSVTVVRMLPVALALCGLGLRSPTVLFLGWFGPRGLASIVFVLLLVEESGLEGAPLVLQVVTTTVALSVLLHGVTAAPGAERYAACFATRGEPSLSRIWEPPPRVRRRRPG